MLQWQTCKAQVEQQGLSQQKFSLLSPLTPSPKKNMFDRDSPNGSCSEKGEGCTLFLHTAHNRTNTLSQVGQVQSHFSSCSPPTAPAQAAAHATRDTSATASFPAACTNSPSTACQNSPTASFSRLETSHYCIMPVLQLHHSVRAHTTCEHFEDNMAGWTQRSPLLTFLALFAIISKQNISAQSLNDINWLAKTRAETMPE